MLLIDHQPPRASQRARWTAFLIVLAIHLLLLVLLALQRAGVFPPPLPAMEVLLVPGGGGGSGQAADVADSAAPRTAVPSAVHVVERPLPWPETLPAPTAPAPQELAPVLTAGSPEAPSTPVAPAAVATEGASAGAGGGAGGGEGSGEGTGIGAGRGPGRNGDWRLELIRGPSGAVVSRDVSGAGLAALPGPYAVLRCNVLPSGAVSGCRVLRAHPRNSGVGRAAIARAVEFRFRPAARLGRFQRSRPVTLAIAFPPSAPESPTSGQEPVDGT